MILNFIPFYHANTFGFKYPIILSSRPVPNIEINSAHFSLTFYLKKKLFE